MPGPRLATRTPVRLFVTDLDDTLNPHEGAPLDLAVLGEIRRRNDASAHDDTIPPLTLITGRPQPYLYAMLQAIGGRLPAVFEHGFGLFDLSRIRVDTHPAWSPEHAAARTRLFDACTQTFVAPGRAAIQIGKLAAVTLEPTPPHTARGLTDQAREVLAQLEIPFALHIGPQVLDFVPDGFHKGVGIRRLAQATGIRAEQVAAMGDSSTDALMFTEVGVGIAPANAAASVREQAALVTAAPATAGVLEAYDALIAHNRSL